MRVLLINAATPGYTLQPYPPLQLGYLAAVLREGGHHQAEILDLGILDVPQPEILAAMLRADVVGVYFVTTNWEEGLRLCALAKRLGRPTMAGGPHAGLIPEETVASGELDYAFIGEAEASLPELLDTLEDGNSALQVPGLVVATPDGPRRTPHRTGKPDLRRLPWPARDLLPMAAYRARSDESSLLASRGCPYPCSFCAIRVMSSATYRRRRPADVIDEAHHLVSEYGAGRLTFFDDIFTIDPRYANALLDEMEKRPIGVPWSCETRVDRIYPDLLSRMRKAGCHRMFFGVESGSQRILDSMSKRTTVSQIRDAVTATAQAGISPVLSIMLGVPDDDEASIRETIAMVGELAVGEVWFQPFAPFPGTAIIPQIGDLLPDDWLYLYRHLDLRTPVLPTRNLSLRAVKDLFIEALLSTADRGWVKPAQAAHTIVG
jgi:anaerobic magnesium-protoporphyrin IX monomethyl ester cyclase